jgi:hypothetical protein
MKTIAITSWNGLVSPLYDVSCWLTIMAPGGACHDAAIQRLTLSERADYCLRQGVAVVLCGAISNMALAILRDRHIAVVPWVCGSVNEVIAAYRQGLDIYVTHAMPGCLARRCGRRTGARRGRMIRRFGCTTNGDLHANMYQRPRTEN